MNHATANCCFRKCLCYFSLKVYRQCSKVSSHEAITQGISHAFRFFLVVTSNYGFTLRVDCKFLVPAEAFKLIEIFITFLNFPSH
jgi:hypothetical protein